VRNIVIVLGNTVTALGTLRACVPLKKEGYEIWLVSTSRNDNVAIRSNIPDRKIVLSNGLVQGLLDLAKPLEANPILLFTRDDEVVEISKEQEKLKHYYRFLLPDHSLVEMLMEKVKFSEFAEINGLPIPRTEYVYDESSLLTIESRIAFPIIIKPYLMHAIKVGDANALRVLAEKLRPVNFRSMVAQEYIEGADDQLYFCFLLFNGNGEIVRSMYARKLRQWPVSYGTTSLAVTTENPKLAEAVELFSKTVKVRGFCSIEFKYDSRNDRFLIMEPTIGRFNQQIALTIASGVNFPLAVVRLLSGERVESTKQKNGVLWIYESNDFFSFMKTGRSHGYITNFFKPHVSVLFSANDLSPLMYEIADMFRKKMKKILRHV
jgi:predicted ATP-grasp superfamily ATP-dependent carboligase